MDRQPRVTDLIPRKHTTFLLLFLAGLGMVGVLEALYGWMPAMGKQSTDGRIAAFDLDGEGGLAVCFSSWTLLLASLTAVLIYSIRQHKEDDYDGRYRIWRWAAACWLLLAIDEAGSLHEGFKEMMTHATGYRLAGDGSLWWVLAYLPLLGYVGVRLLLEMRNCRGSMAAMFACAASYATAVVVQLQWIWADTGARGVMLEEGCEMVGNLFLLLAMGLHARHVIWEATGELPIREPRPAKIKKQKVVTAPVEPSEAPLAAKVKAKAVAAPTPAADDAEPARPRRGWLSWIWRRQPKTTAETGEESAKPRAAKVVEKRKVTVAPTPPVATSAPAKPAPASITKASTRTEPVDDDDAAGDDQYRYDDAEELGENGRKMTRAERKALRRQRREQV